MNKVNTFADDDLARFLAEAKRHTYAGQGDQASVSPLLPGTRQLEYQQGDFFYRDIYTGFGFFAGQEYVYVAGRPVWSMSYAGGLIDLTLPPDQIGKVYEFLQAALREVDSRLPYRGPREFQRQPLRYHNDPQGSLSRFSGVERIFVTGLPVYELRYQGGRVDR